MPPQFSADDTFFDALLGGAPTTFADLKARASRGEPCAPFTVPGVKVTVNVDNTYEPVTTQLTRNVVGMVEGSDPKLKDTYVLFGAHLDHVGYAISNQNPPGRVNNPIAADKIWNGADDDGTGTHGGAGDRQGVRDGPKPKRSVVFIWHAGEEADLYGSRYNADFPIVPLEKIQCQLNIDMIGRNRDNDPAQSNTVFVIGADRISTDLHNLIVDTERHAGRAADARLRVQRSRRTPTASTRAATTTATRRRASRSRSSSRDASRLPRQFGQRREDSVRQAGPRRPAGLSDGLCRGEHRQDAGTGQ